MYAPGEARDEACQAIVEGIALAVGSAESGPQLVTALKAFCAPVLSNVGPASSPNPKRGLRKCDSAASSHSDDSIDMSALDSLTLVPKSVQQAQVDLQSKVPDCAKTELQFITDATFFRQATVPRMRKAKDALNDPKASQIVRTIFGAPHFDPIYKEFLAFLAKAEKANKVWIASGDHQINFGRTQQFVDIFLKDIRDPAETEHEKSWCAMVSKLELDSVSSLSKVIKELTDGDMTLLEDSTTKEVLQYQEKIKVIIRSLQEAIAYQLPRSIKAAKYNPSDQPTVDTAIETISKRKEDFNTMFNVLTACDEVKSNSKSWKHLKAFESFVSSYPDLKPTHLKHIDDWSQVWNTGERLHKTINALSTGDGKWFVSVTADGAGDKARAGDWTSMPLFTEVDMRLLKGQMDSERTTRNRKETPKDKETFEDFIKMVGNTVI